MIKNYFKIAFRTLAKNKLFSLINIFGLALSMSVCLLVIMRIKDQMGYDQFHPHADRTYRIITDITNKDGDEFKFATSPLPVMDNFAKQYPLIESATRLYLPGNEEMALDKKKLPVNKIFADSQFFSVFGFTLAQGDNSIALQQPNSIVLDKETATRFFGTGDALGKIITIPAWGDFIITGILNEPLGKSHIDYQAFISMSTVAQLEKSGKLGAASEQWNNLSNSYTYITIKKGVSESKLDEALSGFSLGMMKTATKSGKENIEFRSQSLGDIIFSPEMRNQIGQIGSKGKTWAEIGIAFVILLSACFNYTNLSIARSLKRGKEIGIRKVSGAFRKDIFQQFLIESMVVSMLSLLMAYVLLKGLIDYAPFIQGMVPDNFSFDWTTFSWFLGFSLFTSVLAGAVPAWALSSFKPVKVLKNLPSIKLFGGNGFRKGLIVAQFSLSIIIIIFAQLFSKQFDYMENAYPGYSRDNRISFSLDGADRNLLTTELSKLSVVEGVTSSSDKLGHDASGYVKVKKSMQDEVMSFSYYDIDTAFITQMGIKQLAGMNFMNSGASSMERNVILNETAVKVLKLKSPAESIGQTILLDDSIQATVAGVVNDFYFRGMDEVVAPLVLRNRESQLDMMTVKLKMNDKQSLATIAGVWKQLNPNQPFNYNWLKEEKGPNETFSMLGFLALIAATLACMGLLGMVSYSMETRAKEIGIRKIMGADVPIIISLISKGFLKLVLIAGCVALPVSYLLGYFFLNIFANHIQQGFTIQVFTLSGLMLLAFVIVISQVIRVVMANPVKSLRQE